MKKNLHKLLLIFMIGIFIVNTRITTFANSVTGSISCSIASLNVGQSADVTINFSAPGNTVFDSTFGQSGGNGGSSTSADYYEGTGTASSGAVTVRVTATTEGQISLGMISGLNALIDSTVDTAVVFPNCVINVVNPPPTQPEQPQPTPTPTPTPTPDPEPTPEPEPEDPKSANYYLSSLTVSPGSLSPAFASRTDVYTVTLPDDATTFSVNGTVEDPTATITQGVGTFNVQPTSFLHKVVIRAENGALWAYDINFIVNDDRSDNSKLESLNVSSGTLSPRFNPETYEYEVELNPSVTSVNITAIKQDDAATISGLGNIDIIEGETNTAEVIVTAENGSTSTYTINFKVLETPPQTIEYNGQELTFETELPEELEKLGFTLKSDLEGFDEGTPYYQNEDGSLTAIYLSDKDSANWYLLNDQQEITGILIVLEVDDKTYGYIEVDEELREQPQMSYQQLTLANQEISGWVYDDTELSDFQMFYLLNEEGQQDFYHFHSEQDGLMRVGPFRFSNQIQQEADQEEAPEEVETSGMSDKEFESLLFLIISLLSIVALVGVVLLIRNRQSKKETL